jgi:hypothetical protein
MDIKVLGSAIQLLIEINFASCPSNVIPTLHGAQIELIGFVEISYI